MIIKKKMLFILVGNNDTGKTTLQKKLIKRLCNLTYERLPRNAAFDMNHPEIKRKYNKISFANRSYQEQKFKNEVEIYKNVKEYFDRGINEGNGFNEQKISFISSHLNESEIEEMIVQGKRLFFNVYGVFLTNSIQENDWSKQVNKNISALNWDERLVIENPILEDHSTLDAQLDKIADSMVAYLVNQTRVN
jgi:predicted ATPase